MDLGEPASYEVLSRGTPVYCADGERIGTVAHVLAAEGKADFRREKLRRAWDLISGNY
jgi:hypothetical protein